jgi:CRP-like cAMP-binding protein
VLSAALLLKPGAVDVASLVAPEPGGGLLVLDGLLISQLEAGRARVASVLGADDFIGPREMDELAMTRGASWRALTTVRVLQVGGRSLKPATRSDVAEQLVARAARTGHWLLAQALILSAPSIQERLLMLFDLYSERWGKVTPQGIRLDMPLTHELLASLCGARRPTVTLALRSLANEGSLVRIAAGMWLLPHRPGRNGGGSPAGTV